MQPAKVQTDRVRGHTFLKNHLNHTGTVIDLGMNKGDFASIIHKKYGCSVIGVEADPVLASSVKHDNGIKCRNAAISATDGFVKFLVNEENSEASRVVPDNTPISKTVIAVPSISLSTFWREAKAETIELLKVDVEGAELEIIETTDPELFMRCKQIAVEFHSFIYPEQTERAKNAIQLLSKLGFHTTDFSTNRTDVLFINSRIINVPLTGKALLVLRKYQTGIIRRLRRIARLPVE